MTTSPAVSRILQIAAVIASFVLTAFAIELGKGTVPISEEWRWTVPIINAAVTGALIFLPRPGSERLAAQVDDLKARGVPKSDMLVVTQEEAAAAFAANTAPGDRPFTPEQVGQLVDELEARAERRGAARREEGDTHE